MTQEFVHVCVRMCVAITTTSAINLRGMEELGGL